MVRSRFLAACAVIVTATSAAHAQSEEPETPAGKLSSFIFPPGMKRGALPYDGLLRRMDNVYVGPTLLGGSCRRQYVGCGAVFQIRPPTDGQTQWTQKVLHAFDGQTEGHQSYSRLISDPGGALYGTTCQGGSNNAGVVFKLTPPAAPGGAWTETVIHNFGGASAAAAAQRLSSLPQSQPAGGSAPTRRPSVLRAIGGPLASAPSPNGSCPTGKILFGSDGALYGTTSLGGTAGFGTVYKLTPPSGGALWTSTVLHSFQGAAAGDGANPYGGVSLGPDSALYGTTTYGGDAGCGNAAGCGTVFRLPLSGGPATVLKAFTGSDGANPFGTVAVVRFESTVASLYGSTMAGGSSANCDGGCGTLFRITGSGEHTILHSFNGTDGAEPTGTPLMSKRHTSFGTTYTGTTPETQSGVIYTLKMGGLFEILHRFKPDGSEGANPINLSGLIVGTDGLYGTTYTAKNGPGAVFRLK